MDKKTEYPENKHDELQLLFLSAIFGIGFPAIFSAFTENLWHGTALGALTALIATTILFLWYKHIHLKQNHSLN